MGPGCYDTEVGTLEKGTRKLKRNIKVNQNVKVKFKVNENIKRNIKVNQKLK